MFIYKTLVLYYALNDKNFVSFVKQVQGDKMRLFLALRRRDLCKYGKEL